MNFSGRADNYLSDNYEGASPEEVFAGMYTGHDDVSLQFLGGQSSFADEGKKGLNFSFTIANVGASAEDRIIAINPGYHTEAAKVKDASGNAVAGIVAEGDFIDTADKVVSCAGKPKSFDEFAAFVKNNPTRLVGLKMLVDNAEQLEQDIYIKNLSPFRNLEDRTITPSDYKDSNQTDDKRAEVPLENVQLDDQTVMLTTIKAGRTATYNFFIGAILNRAAELSVKANIGRSNVKRVYQ